MARLSQRRRALRLWYKALGPYCGYCGIEMISLDSAFEANDRQRIEHRSSFSKEERTRAHNHPTIDHVVPKSQAGGSKMKNYIVCCDRCNFDKDDDHHPGLSRDLKAVWFETIDRHILAYGGQAYPDPY